MNGSGLLMTYDYSGSGLGDITSTAADIVCNQEEGSPLPVSMTTANVLRYIQAVYYMICFLTAVLLNMFVIIIVVRFKQLHTLIFWFSLQIIIVDLINAIIIFPQSAANAIADKFIFTGLCTLFGFFISFFRFARNTLMFVLVVDRFSAIFLPFRYNQHRLKAIIILSIIAWTLTMIFILIAASLGCYQFQRLTWTCSLGIGCENTGFCTVYGAVFIAVVNITAFLSFLLYLALLCKAKKLRNRVVASQSGCDSVVVREIEKRKRKSERRGNTTFFILFTAIIGVTIPTYLLIIFGDTALYFLEATPPSAYTFVVVLLRGTPNLITILDPIVIMRNQDVRDVIQIIIARIRRRLMSDNQENSTSDNIPLEEQ